MSIRTTLINGPLGFGAAPLGNMFRDIPETEALATVEAAWAQGTRLFDTAPFYGAGLSESRLGQALAAHPREQYRLSTKVGRVVLDELEEGARDNGEKGDVFAHGLRNRVVTDYSAAGTLRSIEDSLKRLRTDRLDYVWVHDLAPDFLGEAWLAQFEIAREGAFRALDKLRDEGVIDSWGLGVNRLEPIERILTQTDARPNGMLVAGRYTLLDHEKALKKVMPLAASRDVNIVIGGPYSSGILAGGTHFEYAEASPEIVARVEKIKAIAARHNVPVKAAALQFSLAHPASAAVIPGASRPARIAEDHAALRATVPEAFWRELRAEKLVAESAPLPFGV